MPAGRHRTSIPENEENESDNVNHTILPFVRQKFVDLKKTIEDSIYYPEDNDETITFRWYKIGKLIHSISILLDVYEEQ